MYFNMLVTIHLVTAVFWIGGIFFATFILLAVIKNSDDPDQHRVFLKKLVNRFRTFSGGASALLFVTGILMLPLRSFSSPLRFGALATMILGWVALTAMVFGTMPEEAFSGRPEDVEEKERKEWNPHRLYWIHVAVSLLGIVILAAGVVLAYSL